MEASVSWWPGPRSHRGVQRTPALRVGWAAPRAHPGRKGQHLLWRKRPVRPCQAVPSSPSIVAPSLTVALSRVSSDSNIVNSPETRGVESSCAGPRVQAQAAVSLHFGSRPPVCVSAALRVGRRGGQCIALSGRWGPPVAGVGLASRTPLPSDLVRGRTRCSLNSKMDTHSCTDSKLSTLYVLPVWHLVFK